MLPRVLVLGTGGTIASGINSNMRKPEFLAKDLCKYADIERIAAVNARNIMNIDSSNMQPQYWQNIAKEVYSSLEEYDGIVVTSGTDTMSYTASALSFMLKELNKPVVFTGSQVPIWETGTDAKRNLADSVMVAANADLAEVCIVFNGKIMRGNRTKKFREIAFDAFESVGMNPLGLVEYEIQMNGIQKKRSNKTPQIDMAFESNVFLLKLYPGINPRIMSKIIDLGYKGIVLEGFGAGNIPVIENSFVPYIQSAISNNVPVVITTQCTLGASWCDIYEPGKKALNAGAIPAYDMLSETALVKLMYALGHTKKMEEIRNIMITDIAGEITDGIAKSRKRNMVFKHVI